jgi:hypothetical protein
MLFKFKFKLKNRKLVFMEKESVEVKEIKKKRVVNDEIKLKNRERRKNGNKIQNFTENKWN